MSWPLSQDYNEAIQDPRTSFSDAELRQGGVVLNPLGIPLPRSGNFADVYEVRGAGGRGRWAIKCFTRQVPGLRERYAEISRHLQQAQLPFAVEFQYLEQGIRVHAQWYPVLKMQWVEGLLLNEFVRDNLDRPPLLHALGQIWQRMANRLRGADVAHGDLQHGNVLLVPGSKTTSLAVKLIDYDGMFVPALAASRSGEVGHPAFQHPQRLSTGAYNRDVDRFPLLVIATALRCLAVAGQRLWEAHDNGDNLLFRQADFEAPAQSALFQHLRQVRDPLAQALVTQLYQACEGPLESVPRLEELWPEEKPARSARSNGVQQAPTAGVADSMWAFTSEEEGETLRPSRQRRRRRAAWIWAVPVVAILLALGLGAAAWQFHREPSKPAAGTVAQNKPPTTTPRRTPPSRPKERPREERPREENPPELPPLPEPPSENPDRKARFDKAAVAKARRAIRRQHQAEYANSDGNAQRQLAWKLHNEARQTGGDRVRAYALSCEARDLLIRAGDEYGVLRMSEDLARFLGAGIAEVKCDTLEQVLQADPGSRAGGLVVREGPRLLDIALADDDCDVAARLAALIGKGAGAVNNARMQAAVKQEAERIERLRQEYARIKPALDTLRSSPEDPDANLSVGLFRCAFQGDWEEALPLLARGKDETLRSLAQKDLGTPDDPAALLALARAWQEHAGQAAGALQTACLRRACSCLQEARLGLDPARQKEVDEQLADLREKVPDLKDRWSQMDLARCNLGADTLRLPPGLWISTRQFYRGPIDITIVGRTNRNNFRIAAFDGGRIIFNWEGKPGWMIVNRPNRKEDLYVNYPAERMDSKIVEQTWPLKPQQWYTMRWRITANSLKVWVDGELLVDDDKPNEVSVRRPIRIGGGDSTLEIKSVMVRRARAGS